MNWNTTFCSWFRFRREVDVLFRGFWTRSRLCLTIWDCCAVPLCGFESATRLIDWSSIWVLVCVTDTASWCTGRFWTVWSRWWFLVLIVEICWYFFLCRFWFGFDELAVIMRWKDWPPFWLLQVLAFIVSNLELGFVTKEQKFCGFGLGWIEKSV